MDLETLVAAAVERQAARERERKEREERERRERVQAEHRRFRETLRTALGKDVAMLVGEDVRTADPGYGFSVWCEFDYRGQHFKLLPYSGGDWRLCVQAPNGEWVKIAELNPARDECADAFLLGLAHADRT